MDHLENLEKVFIVLKKIGETVNKKCLFFCQRNGACWVYYKQKQYSINSS